MTQAEVETLLPVITPFTVPATIDALYTIAYAQFSSDAPGCVGTSAENEGITYYIASMLSSGAGTTGVKSEKIDDYKIEFGDGGQTSDYQARYQRIVDSCNLNILIVGAATEQTRTDTLPGLDLDDAGIYTGGVVGEEFV